MDYQSSELCRFTTAGSVDDGKSTLIGRMLYDSKSIFQDQMEQIEASSLRRGESEVNLALLTDGLKSEREQGITIDVAYRYFATPKRKFIIADTPGHIQYTRNMVTGASTANVALVLVDARNGVVEQTKRHAIIASLLQIPHLVVCINKMDLVDYNEEAYENIKEDFEKFAAKLDVKDVHFIPISALKGDNVVHRSERMGWYDGSTLMYYLENVHIASDYNFIDSRFPVQCVIRPNTDEHHDYRGYGGRMTVLLEDEIDISRGDMIVRVNNQPEITQDIDVMISWFNEKPLAPRGKYTIMHTTQEARCMVKEVKYRLNINTLHRDLENKEIKMNDIARVTLRTTKPLFVDAYRKNRITGSVILVDEGTNETVGAGMII